MASPFAPKISAPSCRLLQLDPGSGATGSSHATSSGRQDQLVALDLEHGGGARRRADRGRAASAVVEASAGEGGRGSAGGRPGAIAVARRGRPLPPRRGPARRRKWGCGRYGAGTRSRTRRWRRRRTGREAVDDQGAWTARRAPAASGGSSPRRRRATRSAAGCRRGYAGAETDPGSRWCEASRRSTAGTRRPARRDRGDRGVEQRERDVGRERGPALLAVPREVLGEAWVARRDEVQERLDVRSTPTVGK